MDSKEPVSVIADALHRDPRVMLGILYGSYALGREHPASDIDVAVGFERRLAVDEIVDLSVRLAKLSGKEVDVIDIRAAEGVLLQQVLKYRRTLVKRDSELLGRLIAKSVTDELDFRPLHDI